MKRFTYLNDGFLVNVTWNSDRSTLRFQSGPTDAPDEMVSEFQGLSTWGANRVLKWMFAEMIGIKEQLPDALVDLGLYVEL